MVNATPRRRRILLRPNAGKVSVVRSHKRRARAFENQNGMAAQCERSDQRKRAKVPEPDQGSLTAKSILVLNPRSSNYEVRVIGSMTHQPPVFVGVVP